jgi:hypothetical protein
MAKSSENHSQSQMLVLLTIKFFILKSIVLPGGGGTVLLRVRLLSQPPRCREQ